MLRIIATTAAVVAVASGQQILTWNGAEMTLDNEMLWTGSNLLGGHPLHTEFGSQNTDTVVSAPVNAYTVGSKIVFTGNTKIILGDGRPGSTTSLNFGTASSGSNVATFAPNSLLGDMETGTPGGSALDYNCHLNWLVGDDQRAPDMPPQNGDSVKIKADARNPLQMNTQRTSTAARITGSNNNLLAQCPGGSTQTANLGLLTVIFEPNCASSKFFKSNSPDVESSCGGFTEEAFGSDIVQYYTGGPRMGQAFRKTDTGLVDVSNDFKCDSTPCTYRDQPVGQASKSEESDSSITIIIIIVVAIVAILVIVGVVVVMVKKSGAKDAASGDRGIVSFENPMYDDVQNGDEPSGAGGMYDEPTLTGTSGYMDVPAGADAGGGSGYMDVGADDDAAGFGGTGYMDVAPEADDDDDDDDGDI